MNEPPNPPSKASDEKTWKTTTPTTTLRQTLGLDEAITRSTLTPRPPFPAVIGHRGALYAALENTLPAFAQCAKWNCDGVELDAFWLPKDDSVVVFHGSGDDQDPGQLIDYCILQQQESESKQRPTNILDLTFEETQSLRFNPDFAEFPCPKDKITTARIPLLSQVLETLRGTGLEIKIELKGPDVVGPVLEIVEAMQMTQQCSYSSFDHNKLRQLRQLRPDKSRYPTGALFNVPVPDDYLAQAEACGATEIHLRYDTCTVQRVQAIQKAGFQSMAWLRGPRGMAEDCTTKYADLQAEDEVCYQALWETGVNQICCNRPDVALMLRQENQEGT